MGYVCDIKPWGLKNELNYPHSQITCVILLPLETILYHCIHEINTCLSIFSQKGAKKYILFCLLLNVMLKAMRGRPLYELFMETFGCQINKEVYSIFSLFPGRKRKL